MKALLQVSALISTCFTAVAAAGAEETAQQTYTISGHGTLELPVPKAWRSENYRHPMSRFPKISLHPAEGTAFVVRINPSLRLPAFGDAEGDDIKKTAEVLSKVMAPTAVEKELPLTQLKGPAAHGYYFTATDKAPRPGEYRCMTSAVVGVGKLLLDVTILHQSTDAEEVQQTIEMLKEARLQKDPM